MPSTRPGRAPTPGLTAGFHVVAAQAMARGALASTTVAELADAVGVTRPTFYRRFPTLGHLALDVILERHSAATASGLETGSLQEDLLAVQLERLAMYRDPVVARSLVHLLAAAQRDPHLTGRLQAELIAPHRRRVNAAVHAAHQRGEVDRLPEPEALNLACDLLEGPLLARVVLPGQDQPDATLAEQTVTTALRVLTAPGPAPAPSP